MENEKTFTEFSDKDGEFLHSTRKFAVSYGISDADMRRFIGHALEFWNDHSAPRGRI